MLIIIFMGDSFTTLLFGAVIGALLQSVFTYRYSDKLYKEQQLEESKKIAKAMDISFQEYSDDKKEFDNFAKLYRSEKKSQQKSHSYPEFPLYSQDDPYFAFKRDISRFEYSLSANIYQFYTDLIKAEMYRLYIHRKLKDCRIMNTNPDAGCEIALSEMKSRIISCSDKLPYIQSELKKIYGE